MNGCVCTGPGLTISGLTFSLSFNIALEWEEVMEIENSLKKKKRRKKDCIHFLSIGSLDPVFCKQSLFPALRGFLQMKPWLWFVSEDYCEALEGIQQQLCRKQ